MSIGLIGRSSQVSTGDFQIKFRMNSNVLISTEGSGGRVTAVPTGFGERKMKTYG